MLKNSLFSLVTILFLAFTGAAMAASPNFGPAIYGDGEVWGTKGVAPLPAPNSHNVQAYDKLFIVLNSNNTVPQLPVSEAAPGNRYYNGGRWFTHIAEWTAEGFAYYGTVPILMSYEDVFYNYDNGYLDIEAGTVLGGPPPYFECPLLPVK